MKAMGIQLQGKRRAPSQSERAVAALERLLSPGRKTEKKIRTWGEVAQGLINDGRKCGPLGISGEIDTKGLKRTEIKKSLFARLMGNSRHPLFAQELERVLVRGKRCGHWSDDRVFLKFEWMDYPGVNWKSWC